MAYDYQDMFGKENFFLEIQDHGLEQDRVADAAGVPALGRDRHSAGGDQRLRITCEQSDARAQDILTCIQTGKTMNDPKRMQLLDAGVLRQEAR